MIIGSIKETSNEETRTSLTPFVVKNMTKEDHIVILEKDIGLKSGFKNEEYSKAGARLSDSPKEIYQKAHIITQILPPPPSFIEILSKNQLLIADFSTFDPQKYLTKAKIIHLQKVPRISSAQSIDILSSQSTIRGYTGVLYALYHAKRIAPQIMTAAASLKASSALVIGASLTGLQATSMLKRAGCRVTISDINPQTKDLASSVGASFCSATTADEIKNLLKDKDFIFAAASSSNKSPIITHSLLSSIKPNAIVIDTTASNIDIKNSTANIPFYFHRNLYFERLAPQSASELWANNMLNLLKIIIQQNHLNLSDERITPML